jgi:S-DNA-T family DNA segregation ATPase FtsK/SpoIIIE
VEYMIIAMKSARKELTFAKSAANSAWGYRTEAWLVVVFSLLILLAVAFPVSTWLIFIGIALCEPSRLFGFLGSIQSASNTRRELTKAARDSGFPNLHVESVKTTLPGELISVHVPRGQTVEKLEKASRAMAGCLRVADVRVVGDREDRSRADVSIIRRDVFAGMHGVPWPLLNAETVNIREPQPVGLDEYGKTVNARLLSRNVIIGGSPDSGKSGTLRLFAAGAALDPMARLWMMDAKPGAVEFAGWAPAAYKLVRGRDLDAAVEVFAALEERVEQRYQEIVARGEVFVCDDMELDVLMIDELPQFTRSFENDTKAQAAAVKTIRGGIWKLIALGRAAGMITIISAQKPTADIVPSESRDLIDNKLALHCNTKAMSDTILGAGSGEEAPANAADIPSGQPGVGYYVGDHGVQKIKTFFLTHKQAGEIASRAASRQLDADLESLVSP